MNLEHYAIFEATSDSPVRGYIAELEAQRGHAIKLRDEFAKKHGAVGTYGNDNGIVGLLFKTKELPEGWRRTGFDGEHTIAQPARKTPHGKGIAWEMNHLPRLNDAHWFSAKLGCVGCIRGRLWMLCSYEFVGERLFVFVPLNPDTNQTQVTPAGCTPCKLSAFYAAKEALSVPSGSASSASV